MKSKYAKENKLSNKQENILCFIQDMSYLDFRNKRDGENNDVSFLQCLPEDVVRLVNLATRAYHKYNNLEMGGKLDREVCKLVKIYWDKNGIANSK